MGLSQVHDTRAADAEVAELLWQANALALTLARMLGKELGSRRAPTL
jgi:hypothetical protein